MSLIGTLQEPRHQLVHCTAANTATKNTTQHVHLKIICKTGSNTNKKLHAVACEYSHGLDNGRQLMVYHRTGVR
jgi:hypothetical protein